MVNLAMIDRSIIRARRDILAAQLESARAQYDQLEATLRQLDRQMCAMDGGVQELDALLAEDGIEAHADEHTTNGTSDKGATAS